MKTILGIMLFLGATTMGFAQKKTFDGSADVKFFEPGVIGLRCAPSILECFSITPIGGPLNQYRLEIPAYNINVIATPMGTVNDIPFEDLPIDTEHEVATDYVIKYQESEGIE